VGKNKLARWNELGSYDNVIQPEIGEISGKDHLVKGNWNDRMFRNNNPVILELGCGKGEYTIGLATRFPDNNYVGIDIKGARMWRGARTADEKKLSNVAFLRTRIEFINSFFKTDEVDEIWITFPDPHPGRRNSNKRLTSPWFLNIYRSFVKNNGIVHLKTDNSELYNYTKDIVSYNNLEMIFDTNDLYAEKSGNETFFDVNMSTIDVTEINQSKLDIIPSIKTHYEMIFLNKGMKINYLSFQLNKGKLIEDNLLNEKSK
jgi:tRNA (guanine-N7-)-methyltransferase